MSITSIKNGGSRLLHKSRDFVPLWASACLSIPLQNLYHKKIYALLGVKYFWLNCYRHDMSSERTENIPHGLFLCNSISVKIDKPGSPRKSDGPMLVVAKHGDLEHGKLSRTRAIVVSIDQNIRANSAL